jgi:hypothetical protein
VSVGPASGAHGEEDETNEETPLGQALEPGLPENEYELKETVGRAREPTTSALDPSAGITSVSLLVEMITPSR